MDNGRASTHEFESDSAPGDECQAAIADRVTGVLPEVTAWLQHLVRIPSVSSLAEHADDVQRSAEAIAATFEKVCPDVRVVSSGGHASVLAHAPGPAGSPRVLLYAHHDVQPAGDAGAWDPGPFTPDVRDGRLFGRGAADDKAGVAVHMAALLAHAGTLPVTVTVLIEGEEEIGSPTLAGIIERHLPQANPDVVVIADAVNWAAGTPSLTTYLRGLVDLVVQVETLEHPLHSGAWGGAAPDALGALVTTLASLYGEDGSVAVDGLISLARPHAADYDEVRFRADAGVLDGVGLLGSGRITDRLWFKPAITITAIDSPPVDRAANMLTSSARAKISMRIPPNNNPAHAMAALTRHLRAHAPRGARVTVVPGASAHPAEIRLSPGVRRIALSSLRDAWSGVEPVEMGCGGTLPLVQLFQEKFPAAEILVTGVEDPDTRAHSPNESLYLADFRNACLAEALLLHRLGDAAA